ncbi:MAG: Asp-tRNA(Asn)/Glu-tRNA(Gln) amidotransferase subunit GatA [Deltaproteobacteria bacterium]|nr:Asp-tRNA(Asn)/Glu-tRNA(Gln) amidotransferase subunit GatA [Deltaproteobacteria bacterium]MDQ3300487.1 aspartyl/glutamyl-tRNA amidotransferase subunit A [Myxococcota bacterium]
MKPEFWSITETVKHVITGEITAQQIVDGALDRITFLDREVGAFLEVDKDGARKQAAEIDRKRAAGEPLGSLVGVPVALKDNLVTKDLVTTAGSKILEGWVPPYDATVVTKLRAAGAIIVGKTNLDEFGMGSSTERSAYKQTKNPWDPSRVPGGSSGGSAAAVSAGMCVASLGTDTGGSIRQPAAFCGIVGLKPTYGRVSRWGAVAFASSLDQIGPLTRTVADAAAVLQVIAGHDPRDATSLEAPVPSYVDALTGKVEGLRIGIPHEFFAAADESAGPEEEGLGFTPNPGPEEEGLGFTPNPGIEPEVRAAIERTIAALTERGAITVDISLPHTALALPAYYIVAPAEASSNLSRYDGVRYGKRVDASELLELYRRTRGAGFGPEVKRRIMLGTYALRSGYYDAYYKKAQQIRTLIKRDFDRAFRFCDVVLTPTTPGVAFQFGAKTSPLDMYLGDVFTLSCNLAGLPGINVPCGVTTGGLPIGVQLLGKPLDEPTLLRTAGVIESAVGLGTRRPSGAGGI